jgi:L-lactate dehydrogenase complex protein LldG
MSRPVEAHTLTEDLGSLDQAQVLADIRGALGRTVTAPPAPLEPFVESCPAEDTEALITRFSNELTAVGGNVYRLTSDSFQYVEELAAGIAEICHSGGGSKVALSGSSSLAEIKLTEQLIARGLSAFTIAEAGPSAHEELVAQLAGCDAGVTAVDYAIAETGTIVLSSDEGGALLVSLLPTIHVALLRASQISASLAEVISKLNVERVGQDKSCRSASFITGPSRTSDVELTLSIGVHGPKELHVIVVGE